MLLFLEKIDYLPNKLSVNRIFSTENSAIKSLVKIKKQLKSSWSRGERQSRFLIDICLNAIKAERNQALKQHTMYTVSPYTM